jgi:hypothetical protein
VDINAGGSIIIGTGDFSGISRIDIDDTGTLVMDGFTVEEFGIEITSGSGTFDFASVTLYLVSRGNLSMEWNFNPDTATSSIMFTFANVTENVSSYALFRDGTELTPLFSWDSSDSPNEYSVVISGGWSPHTMSIGPSQKTPGGGADEGKEPPPAVDITYPNLFLCSGELTFEDTRPQAENAILYRWSFGDGTPIEITTEPRVNHTYEEPGRYTVTIRVQYSDGTVEFLTAEVSTIPGECFIGTFVSDIFPILLAVFALSIAAAVIVAISRMRKERRKRVIKWLLAIGISGLVIMVVVVVYAFLKGIPT